MARTPYADPEAEASYQNTSDNSSKPSTGHPDDWVGNRKYKDLYEAADRAIAGEKETGKPGQINLRRAPSITDDPELNPKYAPDMTGKSRSGWNRVS